MPCDTGQTENLGYGDVSIAWAQYRIAGYPLPPGADMRAEQILNRAWFPLSVGKAGGMSNPVRQALQEIGLRFPTLNAVLAWIVCMQADA